MRQLTKRLTCWVLVVGALPACGGGCARHPASTIYGPAVKVGVLAPDRIHESSGLAAGRRNPHVLWTHNDSGNPPVLFAVDEEARLLAVVTVTGARNVDWEDMASYSLDGRSYLLIADIGDNDPRSGRNCVLYIAPEPAVGRQAGQTLSTPVEIAIPFTYSDGERDCEAVAVDVETRTIYLIDKALIGAAGVYALPLPARSPAQPLIAERVADVFLNLVTAMDISPDGRRAVVSTYHYAYEFNRPEWERWPETFEGLSRRVELPRRTVRIQGEAICFGPDTETLYVTTEQSPAPMWRIPQIQVRPLNE